MRFAQGDAMRRTLRSHTIRGLLFPPMEAFHGTSYAIDSVASSPEGDVVITAKQTIGFDPPGITSAVGGAMWAVFQHAATLHKTSEGWKVVAFDTRFLKAGQTRGS